MTPRAAQIPSMPLTMTEKDWDTIFEYASLGTYQINEKILKQGEEIRRFSFLILSLNYYYH